MPETCSPVDAVVTTSRRPTAESLARAQQLAEGLGVPLVARQGASLAELCGRHGVAGAVTIGPERVTYREPASGLEYFYHPNMTRVRLHNCRRGHPDPMVIAMDLGEGDEVLDCTLGRAADAAVCSWVAGPGGHVVGLEKSPIIAHLTMDGLRHYADKSPAVTEVLRRIEAHCDDYRQYLPACATGSFDIVYFDPLFDQPLELSQSMAPLRALADATPLTREAVEEARRVARRSVVIKQRRGSPLWKSLGIKRVSGSSKSRVEYGIVR